jgi:hypothetical protein
MHDHIYFCKEIKKKLIGIHADWITLHHHSEVSKESRSIDQSYMLRNRKRMDKYVLVESEKCLGLFSNNSEQSTSHKALFVTPLLFPVKRNHSTPHCLQHKWQINS